MSSSPLVETETTETTPSPLIETSSDNISNKVKDTFSSIFPTSLTEDVQINSNEKADSKPEPTITAATTDDISKKVKDTFSSILPTSLMSTASTEDVQNNNNENTASKPEPTTTATTDEISNKIKDTFTTFSSMIPTTTTTASEKDVAEITNNAKNKAMDIKEQMSNPNNIKKLLQRIEFQHNWNMQDNRNSNVASSTTKIDNDENSSNNTEIIKDDKVHLEYTINLKLSLDSHEIQLLKESLEVRYNVYMYIR